MAVTKAGKRTGKGDLDLFLVGDRELEEAFHALEAVVQKRVMTKALRRVAKEIQADAKALVQVDRGDTRKQIKVRALKRSRRQFGIQVVVPLGALGEVTAVKRTPGTGKVKVTRARGPGNPAMHLELGTSKMAARPYLRPALEKQRQGARGIRSIGEILWEELAKEAKKQAAKNPAEKPEPLEPTST